MAYNRIQHVKQFAAEYMEDCGYKSDKELTAEDIEFIGGQVQCHYQGVCEILNIPMPATIGPVLAH